MQEKVKFQPAQPLPFVLGFQLLMCVLLFIGHLERRPLERVFCISLLLCTTTLTAHILPSILPKEFEKRRCIHFAVHHRLHDAHSKNLDFLLDSGYH